MKKETKRLLSASAYMGVIGLAIVSNKNVVQAENIASLKNYKTIDAISVKGDSKIANTLLKAKEASYTRQNEELVSYSKATYLLKPSTLNVDISTVGEGWNELEGEWHYFYSAGNMATDCWVGDYYLGSDGKMVRNQWVGNYYVDGNGKWVPNAQEWNWVKEGNIWKYRSGKTGSYATNEWRSIGGRWYYFDGNSNMLTGLQNINGTGYYFDGSGAMATGWVNAGDWYYFYGSGAMAVNNWVGDYYLGSDGKMVRNQWVGNYYVDGNGKWVPNAQEWNWVKEGNIWKYRSGKTGNYTTNEWRSIGGRWYYFDGNSNMVTGLQNINGTGYYFDGSGAMATGWVNAGDWYYFYGSGAMAVNNWVGDYYLGSDGKMVRNQWVGNYYVDGNGKWVPNAQEWNWVKEGNIWKYRSGKTGSYATNEWRSIGGRWYYFDGNSNMVTGFHDVDGATYYFDNSGAMASNGWIGNYYFYADGRLARDTWIGNYYVNEDGVWVPNASTWQWRKQGNNYLYKNTVTGEFARNCWMNDSGYWYYFNDASIMATNQRVGNYVVGSDGKMLTTNTFMNGYFYHIDGAGNIISETKSMYGVDISQWNGDIDLSAYRDGFVIIRAGYGWSIHNEDTYLRKNIAKCNALGIPYGIYWYSYATNTELALQEASAFNSVLRSSGANPVLGVWMDVENDSYKQDKMNWDHATLDPIVKTFCDTVSKNGYRVGVYASYNDFEKNVSTTYRKWVAHWGANNDGTMIDLSNYGAAIHQYTSVGGLDKDFIYDTSYFE